MGLGGPTGSDSPSGRKFGVQSHTVGKSYGYCAPNARIGTRYKCFLLPQELGNNLLSDLL